MAPDFAHEPVMVARGRGPASRPCRAGVIVDATVGGGGHAAALLDAHPRPERARPRPGPRRRWRRRRSRVWRLRPPGRVCSDDARFADLAARSVASARLVRSRDARSAGVLFDLGVSSPQLDRAERGFSYRHDGPLDMRMDPTRGRRRRPGQRRERSRAGRAVRRPTARAGWPGRIARAVVAARPISTDRPAGRRGRRRGARSGPPARPPRPARLPGVAHRRQRGARASSRRRLPDALDLLAVGGRCRGHRLPLGRGPAGEGDLRRGRHRGVHVPAGLPCVCGAVATTVWSSGARAQPSARRSHATTAPRAPACGRSSGSTCSTPATPPTAATAQRVGSRHRAARPSGAAAPRRSPARPSGSYAPAPAGGAAGGCRRCHRRWRLWSAASRSWWGTPCWPQGQVRLSDCAVPLAAEQAATARTIWPSAAARDPLPDRGGREQLHMVRVNAITQLPSSRCRPAVPAPHVLPDPEHRRRPRRRRARPATPRAPRAAPRPRRRVREADRNP